MKRILCILIGICLVFGLSSCGGPADEEIVPVIEGLLAKSAIVNEICFGEGLETYDGGVSIGAYQEASAAAFTRYGIKNTADIREKVGEVYSKETCDWIYTVILQAVMVDSGVQSYARYYDYEIKDENGNVQKTVLMVNENYDPLTVGRAEYRNISIQESRKDRVVFTVDVAVTYQEKTQVYEDEEYIIRFEDGAWKLGTATYATFDTTEQK